jgi:hypothetical protein
MHFRFVPWLAATVALLASCRDAKVAAYRVPSEKPDPLPPILTGAAAPSGGGMAAASVPTAQGPGLTWVAPEHWKPKPASAMRKGSYLVPGGNGAEADCSVTAFPGDVGGELANFNRWRNQLGLAPLPQKDMNELVARLEQNGLKFAVVEFVNRGSDKPQRVIGALVPYEGATWFFKLTGPEELVAREKPAFFAFLQTVKPAAP